MFEKYTEFFSLVGYYFNILLIISKLSIRLECKQIIIPVKLKGK